MDSLVTLLINQRVSRLLWSLPSPIYHSIYSEYLTFNDACVFLKTSKTTSTYFLQLSSSCRHVNLMNCTKSLVQKASIIMKSLKMIVLPDYDPRRENTVAQLIESNMNTLQSITSNRFDDYCWWIDFSAYEIQDSFYSNISEVKELRHLEHVISHCPNLTTLAFHCIQAYIRDTKLITIRDLPVSLESLIIYNQLTSPFIQAIHHLGNLKTLECSFVNSPGCGKYIGPLISSLPRLESVKIRMYSLTNKDNILDNWSSSTLSSVTINVELLYDFDNTRRHAVSFHVPQLTHFSIIVNQHSLYPSNKRSKKSCVSYWDCIVKSCPQLMTCQLPGLPSNLELFTHLPTLTTLSLGSRDAINDLQLNSLILSSDTRFRNQVTTLSLTVYPAYQQVSRMMNLILTNMSELHTLTMQQSKNVQYEIDCDLLDAIASTSKAVSGKFEYNGMEYIQYRVNRDDIYVQRTFTEGKRYSQTRDFSSYKAEERVFTHSKLKVISFVNQGVTTDTQWLYKWKFPHCTSFTWNKHLQVGYGLPLFIYTQNETLAVNSFLYHHRNKLVDLHLKTVSSTGGLIIDFYPDEKVSSFFLLPKELIMKQKNTSEEIRDILSIPSATKWTFPLLEHLNISENWVNDLGEYFQINLDQLKSIEYRNDYISSQPLPLHVALRNGYRDYIESINS